MEPRRGHVIQIQRTNAMTANQNPKTTPASNTLKGSLRELGLFPKESHNVATVKMKATEERRTFQRLLTGAARRCNSCKAGGHLRIECTTSCGPVFGRRFFNLLNDPVDPKGFQFVGCHDFVSLRNDCLASFRWDVGLCRQSGTADIAGEKFRFWLIRLSKTDTSTEKNEHLNRHFDR